MSKPFTTLRKIREHRPCGLILSYKGEKRGYLKLRDFLRDYTDDTPIYIAEIVESNGIDDALWCLKSMPEWDNLWRHFAVDCAERVVKSDAHDDTKKALIVARRFALGLATVDDLDAARVAAMAAAVAARAAAEWAAARAAARAAAVAERAAARAAAGAAELVAARAAELVAEWAAARAAAEWAAARAAARAGAAVRAAAEWAAARAAEIEWQKSRLLALCETGEWSPVTTISANN